MIKKYLLCVQLQILLLCFFTFRGLICSLIIDDLEYRVATYNNSKIIKYNINDEKIDVIIKRGEYLLHIEANIADGLKLVATVNGKMAKNIRESINARIKIELKKNDIVIFSSVSSNCGFEIVN